MHISNTQNPIIESINKNVHLNISHGRAAYTEVCDFFIIVMSVRNQQKSYLFQNAIPLLDGCKT